MQAGDLFDFYMEGKKHGTEYNINDLSKDTLSSMYPKHSLKEIADLCDTDVKVVLKRLFELGIDCYADMEISDSVLNVAKQIDTLSQYEFKQLMLYLTHNYKEFIEMSKNANFAIRLKKYVDCDFEPRQNSNGDKFMEELEQLNKDQLERLDKLEEYLTKDC